jgi:LPS export ABC transporter protein LptC
VRRKETERYARWAAYAAAFILLIVAGVYGSRSFRAAVARRNAPKAVPATVQQASAQFSFSKVEKDRTLFTVRASHATQFKDEDRALLQDVWITVYGRQGDRNDNIHTRECSYEPKGGEVRCEGEVQIDIAAAGTPAQKLQIKTSNLTFNRDTGHADTPAAVEFQFTGGRGSGIGVDYDSSDATLRVEKSVEFQIDPSDHTDGMPVSATGASLEVRRDDHTVLLHGPAVVREGDRELTADQIAIALDADNHVKSASAEGHPKIRAQQGPALVSIQADRIEALLSPAGWVERVALDGNLAAARDSKAENDRFTAQNATLEMAPGTNLAKEMTAMGRVVAQSKAATGSRMLKTEAMRVDFSSVPAAGTARKEAPPSAKPAAAKQTLQRVETLAPASIESVAGGETTALQAKRFVAEADASGRLDKLYGHDGVNVRRQTGKDAPQDISAAELAATFTPSGDWETVDETGGVHFRQLDREVTAAHAIFVRSTNVVTLEGSPVLSDSQSRTTAANVVINQQSGDIRATGGVVSTYLPASANVAPQKSASKGASNSASVGGPIDLGAGEAHVAADNFSASLTSGHATYEGHARLWQAESVLNADRIELFRDDKHLQATGHVVAAFVQEAGPFSQGFGQAATARPAVKPANSLAATPQAAGKPGAKSAKNGESPSLWKLTAPSLAYWSEQGRAHLEGGVLAASDQGSIQSQTMDVFLAAPNQPANAGASLSIPAAKELDRVVAEGSVTVRQGDRNGSAERGEYLASDGKFTLSGGHPTLADNSSNTVTGRSLTFFSASDTILIDSQEGSRTLTKHQVEK